MYQVVEMYRLIDKENLIEMLIESNNHLHRITSPHKVAYPQPAKKKMEHQGSYKSE